MNSHGTALHFKKKRIDTTKLCTFEGTVNLANLAALTFGSMENENFWGENNFDGLTALPHDSRTGASKGTLLFAERTVDVFKLSKLPK